MSTLDKSFQEAIRALKQEMYATESEEERNSKFANYMLFLTPMMLQALDRGETVPSIAALYADNEHELKTLVNVFRAFLFRGLLEINLKQGIIQKPLYDELLAFGRDFIRES